MNESEARLTDEQSLERSLGLPEALTIGVGTMIGAGIFVFPGIAAGRAGFSATVSYAIGGVIALLVALPASELATAMPESGGGYYFVSRGLGSFCGTVVGVGQWLGLMFATAFYLMGLSVYIVELLRTLGVEPGNPVTVLSLVMCVLLTSINFIGTRSFGNVQNIVVVILLVVLSIFIGYGLLVLSGLEDSARFPREFAPFGYMPIFTTSALIFTSYLGFAQIATVAGEIRKPARNLPLAMVGSVLIVGLLYVLAVMVCISVYSPSKLAELGETALIEVADDFFGLPGRVSLMLGGLLATVSSANASIMSSSRALYALSKDAVVPERTARVSERFGTPYISLLMTGGIVFLLILLGHLERLAEVASFLHLVMYGLMCLVLIVLRGRSPEWYSPKFKLPVPTWIVLLGSFACLTIMFFMDSSTLAAGSGVLVLATVWHFCYVKQGGFFRNG